MANKLESQLSWLELLGAGMEKDSKVQQSSQ